jgi:AAA domain
LRYLAPLVNDGDLSESALRTSIIDVSERTRHIPDNKSRKQVDADIDRALSKYTEPFDWAALESKPERDNTINVDRQVAGKSDQPNAPAETTNGTTEFDVPMPRLWDSDQLAPAKPVEWLAANRIPRGAACLLVGDEGIGKSLFWIWIVAAITASRCRFAGTPDPYRLVLVLCSPISRNMPVAVLAGC